jgi:hypothetical protein
MIVTCFLSCYRKNSPVLGNINRRKGTRIYFLANTLATVFTTHLTTRIRRMKLIKGQRANNIKWGSIITLLIINVKLEIFCIKMNRVILCLSCSQTEWEMEGEKPCTSFSHWTFREELQALRCEKMCKVFFGDIRGG